MFECWLHPARYRTQLCSDGLGCKRRVCFFAHQESELRKPEGGAGISDQLTVAQQLQADLALEALALQSQSNIAQALKSYVHQQKSRQEEAIVAAAQLLDPLAKLRLLASLQQQATHDVLVASPPSSASSQQHNALHNSIDTALLTALRSLQLSSSNSGPLPTTTYGVQSQTFLPAAGPFDANPQANPSHLPAAVNAAFRSVHHTGAHPAASSAAGLQSRHSIDLSTTARNIPSPALSPTPSIETLPQTLPPLSKQQQHIPYHHGNVSSHETAAMPTILGSLPTPSYMEFCAAQHTTVEGSPRGKSSTRRTLSSSSSTSSQNGSSTSLDSGRPSSDLVSTSKSDSVEEGHDTHQQSPVTEEEQIKMVYMARPPLPPNSILIRNKSTNDVEAAPMVQSQYGGGSNSGVCGGSSSSSGIARSGSNTSIDEDEEEHSVGTGSTAAASSLSDERRDGSGVSPAAAAVTAVMKESAVPRVVSFDK